MRYSDEAATPCTTLSALLAATSAVRAASALAKIRGSASLSCDASTGIATLTLHASLVLGGDVTNPMQVGAARATGTSTINASALSLVVEMNEGAKTVLGDSHEIELQAFDAIVRSIHGGERLRSFATVSQQMRGWGRELRTTVVELKRLTRERVALVGRAMKERRLANLLGAAIRGPKPETVLHATTLRLAAKLETLSEELRRNRRRVRLVLEELQQLGLMACVLSTAAQLEAAAGDADQFRDLTLVSKGFAERSNKVSERIRSMLISDQQGLT